MDPVSKTVEAVAPGGDRALITAIGILGSVLAAAAAVVSMVVAASRDVPTVNEEAATEAMVAVGSTALPHLLTNRRHEEIVWRAGGTLGLRAPWAKLDPAEPFVALAHDPTGLPPTRGEVSPLSVRPPWVARRYGSASKQTLDLTSTLGRDRVEVAPLDGGPSRVCDNYRMGRWWCGPNPWNYVGLTTVRIASKSAECIWMHPVERHALELRLPKMPVNTKLRARYALTDDAVSKRTGADVELRVLVDGRETLKVRTHNRPGWRPLSAVVQGAADQLHEISLVVTAKDVGRRYFCVAGELELPKTGMTP